MQDAELIGDLLLVRVITGLAWCELAVGELTAATEHIDVAHELAERLHHPIASREVLGVKGAIASMGGDVWAALAATAAALEIATGAGDLEGRAIAHGHMGVCHHLLADGGAGVDEYLAALEHYQQAAALDRALGRRVHDAMTSANVAQVHLRLGNEASARGPLLEALRTARSSRAVSVTLLCVLVEADRQLERGLTDRALRLLAIVEAHPGGTTDTHEEIGRVLARVGLGLDALDAAWPLDALSELERVLAEVEADLADAPDAAWARSSPDRATGTA
jgi:tetratricopeptide (TPR) repeat protein